MVVPTLTTNDIIDIAAYAESNPIGAMLHELKNYWTFTVGDTLVRYVGTVGSNKIDQVSTVCPVPKKFRVMHIDALGMPWVKQLSVRGGLGLKLAPLSDIWLGGTYRYRVDPEQIDSILLGCRYDPRAEYRKHRNENPNYGKK